MWAYGGTSVDHWNGHKWTATSVKSLLPAKVLLNNPSLMGIIALSGSSVDAIGNGDAQDEGGPLVLLHYNGHRWAKVAQGQFGYGPGPQISPDGAGGLWLPMNGPSGGTSYLVHYTGGKLVKAKLPVSAPTITVMSVARVRAAPGSWPA